jgi:hypothetical protein
MVFVIAVTDLTRLGLAVRVRVGVIG